MRDDIFGRATQVLRAVTSERRRYKELEEETGIPASNWQSAVKGEQKLTAVMIEAVCRRWPKYAFWIATGLTDPENGHTAPAEAYTSRQGFSPLPVEKLAERYFDAVTLLQDYFYGPLASVEQPMFSTASPLEDPAELSAPVHPESGRKRIGAKPTDTLGETIAWLAFTRRMNFLMEQFKDAEIEKHNPKKLVALIDELRLQRAEKAVELSKKPVPLRRPAKSIDSKT